MNDHEELKDIASQITRRRTTVAFGAAIVGAVVTVLLIVFLGGLVYFELRDQNKSLEEQLRTNREISATNRQILKHQARNEQQVAEKFAGEVRRNRQQLRAMRQQHNEILILIRGIIKAMGREELLEGLPAPGGDLRPSRER